MATSIVGQPLPDLDLVALAWTPPSVGIVSRPVMTASAGAPTAARSRIGAYVALTKPRIIELLLVTTLPTMVVAARGMPPIGLMLATLIGGAPAAGGAHPLTTYVCRGIDAPLKRAATRAPPPAAL